jgi:hypothetical protein
LLLNTVLTVLLTSSITFMKIESEMKSDCVLQWSPNLFLAVCLHVKVVHDISTLTRILLFDLALTERILWVVRSFLSLEIQSVYARYDRALWPFTFRFVFMCNF